MKNWQEPDYIRQAREHVEATQRHVDQYAEDMGIKPRPSEQPPTGQNPIRVVDLIHQLPRHPFKEYERRNLSEVTHLIVHHTAGEFEFLPTGTDEINIRSLGIMHVNLEDSPGIAFHRIIGGDGVIYKTQPLEHILPHTQGMHKNSVAVAVIGNYDQQELTAIQALALASCLQEIEVLRQGRVTIAPHSAFRETSCPGKNIRDSLGQIREVVDDAHRQTAQRQTQESQAQEPAVENPVRDKLLDAREDLVQALASEDKKTIRKWAARARLSIDVALEKLNGETDEG